MTLEQIRRHPYYPFRDFGGNDLSFLMLELYWAELFKSAVAGDPGAAAKWKPMTPADRTEGNPILYVIDRMCSPARKLRIIQRFNTEHLAELDLDEPAPVHFTGDAYVAFAPGMTYGATDEDGVTPTEELVIASDVSKACERLSSDFIRKWCVERVPVSVMQQEVNTFWAIVEKNLIESPAA